MKNPDANSKFETYIKGNGAPFHPNRISAYGAGFVLGSVLSMMSEWTQPLAPFLYLGGAYCDTLDGRVAREFKIESKEGAKLDPLMDKVKNYAVGTYIIAAEYSSNPYFAASNILSFAVDYVSQRKRGPFKEQLQEASRALRDPESCTLDYDNESKHKADYFGKAKTVIQNIVHFSYITMVSYGECISDKLNINNKTLTSDAKHAMTVLLYLSAICGCIGIYRRMKKK